MSVNKYESHVFVLPEDDANRQLAIGFLKNPSVSIARIKILPVAGGWRLVLQCFESEHVPAMTKYPERTMVLLIDFDGHVERLEEAKAVIPIDLKDRVFVLGVLTKPEDLKRAHYGSYESIGEAMAKDCREETKEMWGRDLLLHNADEIARLSVRVRPILFPPN